jgi:hypothetical protein
MLVAGFKAAMQPAGDRPNSTRGHLKKPPKAAHHLAQIVRLVSASRQPQLSNRAIVDRIAAGAGAEAR